MIADIDVYRSANVLIDQYGESALLEAMDRVERYHRMGNASGMRLWNRIADAIETLMIPPHLATQTSH